MDIYYICLLSPARKLCEIMFLHMSVILFTGGLYLMGSLSRGVSVQGVSVGGEGGSCPWGICPWGLCGGGSLWRGSLWRGSLSRGSLSRGLCPGGSLSGGGLCQGEPPGQRLPPPMVMCGLYASYWNAFLLALCFLFLYQIKIWNSATNKSNYTVTVATENLECRPPSLLVYGGQDIPDYLTSATTNNRIPFLGNRKLLILESSVNNSNGQNECVFRHTCDEDMCHYVFISVQNVPDQSSWKICEVYFD